MNINELIIKHLSYADRLATQKHSTKNISYEELQSAVYSGLVDAVHAWKPNTGTEFTTYAFWRINGAMDDYIRLQVRYWQSFASELSDLCTKHHINTYSLDELLSTLAPAIRKIFEWYYLEGWSKSMIAQRLKVSEKTISTWLSRHKKELKKTNHLIKMS